MVRTKAKTKPLVEIYTDGACSGNPGPGGWAAILRFGEYEKTISGFDPSTTNNRMELTAALKALQELNQPCRVKLHSDSSYLINAFEHKWLDKWIKNNWKNAAGNPVINPDLWRALLQENDRHEIEWIKVRGHADDEDNIRCDKMAVDEIKRRQ
ncbi:MAG: ribonuclease HI [Saccharofermentanales bacterium]|jgi:ribonuclease HI